MCLAVALLERAIDFALNVALGHVFALVVELLAATQAQQQLYATIGIKVEFQRHQRIAAIAKFTVKKVDLLAVQQQTAPTVGIAIPHATMAIRVDMQADEPALPATNQCKGIGNLARALANRLDLGTAQLNTALKRLIDKVLVMCRAILGDELALALTGHRRPPRHLRRLSPPPRALLCARR